MREEKKDRKGEEKKKRRIEGSEGVYMLLRKKLTENIC